VIPETGKVKPLLRAYPSRLKLGRWWIYSIKVPDGHDIATATSTSVTKLSRPCPLAP
jgi:hypothetical protein